MQRLIPFLCLLFGLALGACRTSSGAPGTADEIAARPEVRYYMIADA